MSLQSSLLASTLLSALVLSPVATPDQPRFVPEESAKVAKRVELRSESSLDEMTVVVDGKTAPAGLEMDLSVLQVIAVTDHYEELSEGRPERVSRTFVEVGSETTVKLANPILGESQVDVRGISELEGATVVYDWNASANGYSPSFPSEDGRDESLLERLTYDMDYAGLLPRGEVASGDTWDIPLDSLRTMLAPSGDLKIAVEEDEALDGLNLPRSSLAEILGDMTGGLEGTYGGTREEGGTRVAVIALAVDIVATQDLTSKMAEIMKSMEGPAGMEISVDVNSYDVTLSVEGKGEALWNLDGGRLHSLRLTTETEQEIDVDMDVFAVGKQQNLQNTMVLAGTQELTVSIGG